MSENIFAGEASRGEINENKLRFSTRGTQPDKRTFLFLTSFKFGTISRASASHF